MGLPRPSAGTPVHDYLAQHRSQMVILNWPWARPVSFREDNTWLAQDIRWPHMPM